MQDPDCIFCKIVAKEIPSEIIYETDHILAFMDVNPLSEGHCLFIPKAHASNLHETDDNALEEMLVIMKLVANAMEVAHYNVLQNNGSIAHQAVMHTHFHLIPKPNEDRGLKIGWNPIQGAEQASIAQKIRSYLS